jgi:parallel beta-helix repeat protein
MSSNIITNTSDDAIYIDKTSDMVIKDNTITDTGVIAGYFKGQPYAVLMSRRASSNILIENNIIERAGYIGISFYGKNIIIKNNSINHPLHLMNDGVNLYL